MIATRIAALFLCAAASHALAQPVSTTSGPWPTKPVRIMVGASAGGGTDIIARMLGDKLGAIFGQPFVVENRPGAANTIASDVTAKSPADGYTLLVGTNTAQAIAPHIMKLGFNPVTDLTPIALLVVVPNVVAVAPNVTAGSIRELVADIKAKPGAYSCGSSGIGSTQHLACEAFALATGTKIVHVPYKGSSQALTDLVGGQIQLDFDTTSSAMSFIKGGKAKALAVMTPKRSAELPDVPTLAEAGVPKYEATIWLGLMAPKATPPAVVERLNAEVSRIVGAPETAKAWTAQGAQPMVMSVAEFTRYVQGDIAKWANIVKISGAKPEQ